MFGFSEALNNYPIDADADTDLLCFTDDPELTSTVWHVVCVPNPMLDPPRASKRMKILPHRFLGDYDCSLYIDNTVRLKQPVTALFQKYLDVSPSPMVCFRHPWRNCIYDEAQSLIELSYDDPGRITGQMEFYRSRGIREQGGLLKGAFLLRRHNNALLRPVMECWFEQVLKYSSRDQLSLPVAMQWMNFSCGIIEEDFLDNDILDWSVIPEQRLPRDFDDIRYLSLHPDVKIAGTDRASITCNSDVPKDAPTSSLSS